MNKIVLLVLAGILSLSAQSCSSVSKFNDAKKDLEKNTAQPSSIRVNATGNKAETQANKEAKAKEKAEAEAKKEMEMAAKISGLVPATNPEMRVRGNVRGRQDPFSAITVEPELVLEEDISADKKSETPIRRSRRGNRNQETTSNPSLETDTSPFEPTLAQDVKITGLIVFDGRPKLIVEAPEETSSRYVEVGQYLSNGQILVKSIDMNHFPTPLVILEQSGVEIAKTIGDEGSGEESEISLTDSLPIAAITR